MSLKVGRVNGAPIILTDNLLVYIGMYFGITLATKGLHAAAMVLLAIAAVALCITLHEIGHVLAAKRYGIRPIDITLNFFGGIASSHPSDWRWLLNYPAKAAFVWICGPAVNAALALLLTLAMFGLHNYSTLCWYLSWVRTFNIAMGIFNLLPLYPTDGGGLLFCGLRAFTNKARAIKIASIVSMVGCVLLLLAAIKYRALVAGIIAVALFFEAKAAPKSALFRG